jgi:flagellar basal-body rod protein FlgB
MDVFSVASRHAIWLQDRQQVLAGNIANSDTPGYKAKDLTAFRIGPQSFQSNLAATHRGHFQGADGAATFGASEVVHSQGGEATHSGNTISLEREMKKVGETASAFNFNTGVTRLFHRMLLASVKG